MPKRNAGAPGEIDGEMVREKYTDPDAEFSDEEIRWLQDHGISQEGDFEPQPVTFLLPTGQVVSNDSAYFAQQQLQDQEAFEAAVEQRAKVLAEQMLRAEQAGVPQDTEYKGSATGEPRSSGPVSHPPDNSSVEMEDEESEDEYSSWTNEQLRAELADRDLSVSGKHADLVARLEEDDAGSDTVGDEEGGTE